jgi:N-acetylneuraminate synthase
MTFREHVLAKLAPDARTPGRCLIVAEIAQAHDGSLGTAHAYVDAVAHAGADAVKFQTHIASAESTPAEPWRVRFSPQDDTRYDYWRRTGFDEPQWAGLREHAERVGLAFLSSPFSLEAVELLGRVGVAAWKVASGELADAAMLDAMARTGLPMILSTGMSPLAEIDRAVDRVRERGAPLAVLQCVSKYPCPPEQVGVTLIPQLRERYGCAAGLSDHSGTIYPAIAAAVLGAEVVEVHVAFSREVFGPDVVASVTTAELARLVEGVRFVERMVDGVRDKDDLAAEVAPLRALFTKSVVARVAMPAGTVLTVDALAAKKPGTGIPASRLESLVGARLTRDVAVDEPLRETDLVR